MENNKDNSVMAHIKSLTEKEELYYGKEDLSDDDVKGLHHDLYVYHMIPAKFD